MEFRKVSDAVVKRMPRYYRHLKILEEHGVDCVSSNALAKQLGLTASQVRQDFNCFGGFGQQGYGYNVRKLRREIRSILAIDKEYSAIVVGAGNIGTAITYFGGFQEEGIHIVALFDVDPDLIGKAVNDKPVLDVKGLGQYIKDHDIDIGIITARRSVAQQLADSMAGAGIKGIWNFAPVDIVSKVPVENVHLFDSISNLTYKIGKNKITD